MCDYSLHLVASRPAKVGDKLVTTKFHNSLTGGFAGVQEPSVAVCLLCRCCSASFVARGSLVT